MKKTVLLIGGGGFIGSHLRRELVAKGYRVVVFGRGLPDDRQDYEGAIVGDVCKRVSWKRMLKPLALLLKKNPIDAVYWFAAKQGYEDEPVRYANTNIGAMYLFFEELDRSMLDYPRKFILASSQAIYKPRIDAEETAKKVPPSLYGHTKWLGEQATRFLCNEREVKFWAMRYSIVLGAGQSMSSEESGILRNWVRCASENKHPQVYADGTQVRDFVHVKDVTAANLLPLEGQLKPGAYNVSGLPSNIWNLAVRFSQLSGCPVPERTMRQHRPGGEYSLTSSSDKIRKAVGWEPTRGLNEQIEDFLHGLKTEQLA